MADNDTDAISEEEAKSGTDRFGDRVLLNSLVICVGTFFLLLLVYLVLGNKGM